MHGGAAQVTGASHVHELFAATVAVHAPAAIGPCTAAWTVAPLTSAAGTFELAVPETLTEWKAAPPPTATFVVVGATTENDRVLVALPGRGTPVPSLAV